MRWLRKRSGPRCAACRGTGLRWGWWTLVITLPVQMLADVLMWLLPLVVIAVLLIVGLSLSSATFWLLYALASVIGGWILVHYLVKLIAPRCGACAGSG